MTIQVINFPNVLEACSFIFEDEESLFTFSSPTHLVVANKQIIYTFNLN